MLRSPAFARSPTRSSPKDHHSTTLFHEPNHFGIHHIDTGRHEHAILEFPASKDRIPCFYVGQSDAFIASTTKRRVFVGLDGLHHSICAADGELRRLDRLHFPYHHSLAHRLFHALLHLRLRRRGTYCRSCPRILACGFATYEDVIADFEIGELGLLLILAEASAGGGVDSTNGTVWELNLQCRAAYFGDFSKSATAEIPATLPALATRTL